jgi:iron complex outermembrane receptor protein
LNYLKNRVDININHSILKNISADWHLTFQDRNGQFEQFVDNVSQGLVEYKPFILCDLKISWQHSGWTFYGMASNLFDVAYFDIGNVVQPGRLMKLGLVKKIEFK